MNRDNRMLEHCRKGFSVALRATKRPAFSTSPAAMLPRSFRSLIALAAIAAAVTTVACNKSSTGQESAPSTANAPAAPSTPSPTPAPAPADPAAAAQSYFTQNCVVCHGSGGQGDGPGAANLNPKPQNYTDPAWQAKVQDDELKKAIVQGGLAVGRSPIMPAHPDLKDKPQVLDALIKIIRSFGKK